MDKKISSDLMYQGVQITLDRWDLKAGQDLFHFMEKGISTNEFVLAICSPTYASKADNRSGGAGYETRIAAAVLADDLLRNRFIPILRRGSSSTSIPTYLRAALYLDFRDNENYEITLEELLKILFREESKPTLGWRKTGLSCLFGTAHPNQHYQSIYIAQAANLLY